MVKKIDELQGDYKASNRWRGLKEWAFRIATLGFGAFGLKTSIVKEGQLGLRCDSQGKMTLLPPGRYHKFPWESYPAPPLDISSDLRMVNLKPYKILTVEPDRVAGIYQNQKLVILSPGQYVLDPAEEFFRTVFVGQKTESFKEFTVFTNDNIGLTIDPAEVCFQITHPEKMMVKHTHEQIANKIKSSISDVVKKIKIAAFLPLADEKECQGEFPEGSHIIDTLRTTVSIELNKIGVKFLSMNPTWTVEDKYKLVETLQNHRRRRLSAEGTLAAVQIIANGVRNDSAARKVYMAPRRGSYGLFSTLRDISPGQNPVSSVQDKSSLPSLTIHK